MIQIISSLLLILGLCRGGIDWQTYKNMQAGRVRLKQTLARHQGEVEELKLELERIHNSKNYAYKVLRDRYLFLEEGESVMFTE